MAIQSWHARYQQDAGPGRPEPTRSQPEFRNRRRGGLRLGLPPVRGHRAVLYHALGIRVHLFSTPLGKSGYFYQAVDGRNADRWYSPHWPTEISPFAEDDYLERKREEKDSQSFAQEYKGEFVSAEDALIPHELVEPILGAGSLEGRKWLGVDIAREGTDSTVYTEIDEHGAVNVVDSEETSTIDGILGRIRELHRENQYESIIVEENAVGGGVVDFGSDLKGVMQPFKSSTKSKHQLYKRLKKDVESEDIALRTIGNSLTSSPRLSSTSRSTDT